MSVLAESVEKLKNKIHLRNEDGECTRDHHYRLIIYYSGHGGREGDDGDWMPDIEDTTKKLDFKFISKTLKTLVKCDSCPACE